MQLVPAVDRRLDGAGGVLACDVRDGAAPLERRRGPGLPGVTLTEAGVPLDDDLVAATTVGDKRGTAEVLGRLLSLREPPTAIFAEQDEVAVAVIRALRRTRIAVPEGISVLGFDDQPLADWFDLSTVAQSPSDIGREAGELALRLIEDSQVEHAQAERERHVVLPTHVIPRATTAPAPRPQDEREVGGEAERG
ncbi:substrate-binding domain-containing protein [Streptomyces caeruleatus]|uniref:substrate-binding domain-containing protein n=1 Tax=Streptomyces caeruleatus TaxID=661399 RepID=UPI000AC1DB6C|nr:substrate-binding domain-containing protein [Streptomyces caeruleatus]